MQDSEETNPLEDKQHDEAGRDGNPDGTPVHGRDEGQKDRGETEFEGMGGNDLDANAGQAKFPDSQEQGKRKGQKGRDIGQDGKDGHKGTTFPI